MIAADTKVHLQTAANPRLELNASLDADAAISGSPYQNGDKWMVAFWQPIEPIETLKSVPFAMVEVFVRKKGQPNLKKAAAAPAPDLRKDVHGALTISGIDAGAVPNGGKDVENLATPDFSVPEGQTTHE